MKDGSNSNNGSKTYSKEEFFKEGLGVDNPDELKDKDKLNNAAKKLKKIDFGDLKKYLEQNPELVDALKDVIKSLTYTVKEIKDTQKVRWEVLKAAVESGNLTGDQIIEFVKMLKDLDVEDNKPIEKIIDALKTIGQSILVILTIIAAYMGYSKFRGGNDNSDEA